MKTSMHTGTRSSAKNTKLLDSHKKALEVYLVTVYTHSMIRDACLVNIIIIIIIINIIRTVLEQSHSLQTL